MEYMKVRTILIDKIKLIEVHEAMDIVVFLIFLNLKMIPLKFS